MQRVGERDDVLVRGREEVLLAAHERAEDVVSAPHLGVEERAQLALVARPVHGGARGDQVLVVDLREPDHDAVHLEVDLLGEGVDGHQRPRIGLGIRVGDGLVGRRLLEAVAAFLARPEGFGAVSRRM